MQDIRKPYSRSKSDRDISSRVEAFEKNSYPEEEAAFGDEQPVQIPVRKGFKGRRNIDQMDMYPTRGRRAYDTEQTDKAGRRASDGVVYHDPRTRYISKRQTLGTLAFIGSIIVLGGGALLLTFVFNRATITITPKYADLSGFKKTITFAKGNLDTDATVAFIVSTSSLSKSKTLTLSETKKVEAKASGRIVIYNNFSTDPQRLIKNTRFESTAGKIYRINQSITVPGKSGNTPGNLEVTVYADSFGADYNSAPTDFTIPGFKGAPQYTTFYGRSKGPLSGGSSGNASMASLSDINAAKDELALSLAQDLKITLSKVKEKGYVGLYSAIDIVYSDNEDELLRGTTSTYAVTATGYLMLAKEDELAKSVAETIRDYNSAPVRLDNTDSMTYTKKDTDNVATSDQMDIMTEGNPRVVYLTDSELLKKMVVGKKRSDFTTLMKSIDSIEGAEIDFSPLWLSTFPTEESKISIVESLPKR